jgi:hypothetical protein
MNAMPFVRVIEAQAATKYVQDELSGGATLAKLVARSIDLSGGSLRVAMPVGMNPEGLDFRYETFNSKQTDRETDFARFIKSFISAEGCGVLLQNMNMSMSDPHFAELPYRNLAMPYAGEVYWNVADAKLANLSDDEMGDLINYGSFWPFSAFFYVNGLSPTKSELNDADLQLIVNRLVGVAVGAFDDRSYLVWWRDDLWPFPLG